MIIHDMEQGSPEWVKIRLGIPTASNFNRILTTKTLKPSAQQDGYITELVAEYAIGEPAQTFTGGWIERGTELEDEARSLYAFDTGTNPRCVGFVSNDDLTVGGSPDALVDNDGGLEIKCPAAKTHIAYLLSDGELESQYRHQIQGNIWVLGAKWWDVMTYCPGLPAGLEHLIKRVPPDPAYQLALDNEIPLFLARLQDAKDRIDVMRGGPAQDIVTCPISGDPIDTDWDATEEWDR